MDLVAKWCFLGIGSVLVVLFSFLYVKSFSNISEFTFDSFVSFVTLGSFIVFIILGLAFILLALNLSNSFVKYTIILLLGGFIREIFQSKLLQTGSILLIIILLFYIVVLFTKNIFSTIISFSLFVYISVILISKLIEIFPQIANTIGYVVIVVSLVSYKLSGTKINRFIIGKIMGFGLEAEQYDKVQLKEQLNFIYLLVFILLNITNMFYGYTTGIANWINNSFLTGIAIININWEKIFWFLDKSR